MLAGTISTDCFFKARGLGYSGFQVKGMIEWRQKSKPQKIPGPNSNPPKIPCRISESRKFLESIKWYNTLYFIWLYFIGRTTRPEYVGTTTNLQIILNTPKKSLIKSSHPQENTCQMFLPKKFPESKISNRKKSFDHPLHLKYGEPWARGVLRISREGLIKWGQKSKPMKIPRASNKTQTNPWLDCFREMTLNYSRPLWSVISPSAQLCYK